MFESSMTAQLAFALAVAGAGYEPEGVLFHDQMVKEKRIFASLHWHELDLTPQEAFSTLQSFTIYNFLGLFHEDLAQRTYCATAHESLINLFRQRKVIQAIQQSQWSQPAADCSSEEREASWREWIHVETLKRIAFLVFLLDLDMSTMTNTPGLLRPHELAIPVPAATLLWDAPTAKAWHSLMLSSPLLSEPAPLFLSLLDAILCLEWPASGSNSSRLIPRLSEIDRLGLHVLGETLIRIERQLLVQLEREAQDFRSNESSDGRDKPEVALRRVQNGLRILDITGGWKSDRGKWFGGVRVIFL